MNEIKAKQYFVKMLDYITKAQKSIKGITYEQFVANDDKLFSASFVLSQIAELAKNFSDEEKQKYPNIKWSELRAIRNRIIHDYDSVDFIILWNVIKDNLPQMARDIKQYIK